MESLIVERMRKGLLQKRDSLSAWLHATPPGKKEVLLGPSTERAVHARLDGIDAALLKADSKTLGKCDICHGEVNPELLEVDYTASVCIDHLSEEERRHLESELELAQRVQQMLLPPEAPHIPGLEVAAFSRPAQFVGGDYFDFIDFSNGTHGLAIADVAGHGVAASLQMASIQALLRALVPLNTSPAQVMSQVHKLFIHNIRFDTFVTFFLGSFDSSTKTFAFCNAGHQPPLVLRNSRTHKNSVDMLLPTGAAIGLIEEAEFAEKTMQLQTEDLLVLYTDGVTEAVNPQNHEFGRERLAALSRQPDSMPAKHVVQEIRKGLGKFSDGKPFADDITIVACRIT
ncbi:MAG: SpoIIE family protein phosphatase [Hyphomicrobiales bacterium]